MCYSNRATFQRTEVNNLKMQVDETTDKMEGDETAMTIEDLLLKAEFAISRVAVTCPLGQLELIPWQSLSKELVWLKQLSPGELSDDSHSKWFKDSGRLSSLWTESLLFTVRQPARQISVPREASIQAHVLARQLCPLYNKIMSILHKPEKIILTGNAGISEVLVSGALVVSPAKQFKRSRRASGSLRCEAGRVRFASHGPASLYKLEAQRRRPYGHVVARRSQKTLYLYEPGTVVLDQPPQPRRHLLHYHRALNG